MANLINEISICLIIAGLLGLYIGYLLGKDCCNQAKTTNSHH